MARPRKVRVETTTAWKLLQSFVIDTGEPWGTAARRFQVRDAKAIMSPDGPRLSAIWRCRGAGKTQDLAAVALALLICDFPVHGRGYCYAWDERQAMHLHDAMRGIVARTPGLDSLVDVTARTVRATETGATMSIESSESAGAFGTNAHLVIIDEIGVWRETRSARTLVEAVLSAQPKQGGRVAFISTPGAPVSLAREIHDLAAASKYWYTSTQPGPSPFWSKRDVEAARESMTDSGWARLVKCEWVTGEDSLVSETDIDACIRAGSGDLEADPRHEYTCTLDVGTRSDWSACVVAHTENRPEGRVVVVDAVRYWIPSRGNRVNLNDVEESVVRLLKRYRCSTLRFDRMQAEQLTASIESKGLCRVEEFKFTSAGANQLARALHGAVRDRALSLPDDVNVREQFLQTKITEASPGNLKLQNLGASHDDIPTAVGMAVVDLLERPVDRPGKIWKPTAYDQPARAGHRTAITRSTHQARRMTPTPSRPRR